LYTFQTAISFIYKYKEHDRSNRIALVSLAARVAENLSNFSQVGISIKS